MIYSEEKFKEFAKATIAMRDRLQQEKRTLPWGGEDRPVIDADGDVDREIAWAMRKKKFSNVETEHEGTLAELKVLIDRINTLDYMTRYTSTDKSAGAEVKQAVELVTKLRDTNSEITPGVAKDVATTLEGDVALGRSAHAERCRQPAGERVRALLRQLHVGLSRSGARVNLHRARSRQHASRFRPRDSVHQDRAFKL